MLIPSRRLATTLLTLLVLTAVSMSGAAATATQDPPPGRLSVGVQFKGMWSDYTDAQRVEVLDKLARTGARWVRIDVSWAMLQPQGPDSYDPWGVSFVDKVIDMATDRGLTPLVTLWLTPAWANGARGDRVLPSDPGDYGRAARWAALRWRGKVGAWEVWNEPNDDHFLRGKDPVAYTALLQAAYAGFKSGSPTTPVVFGGTSYVDVDWVARAYAAGAGGHFDVMGSHPYQGIADEAPELPDNGTMWRLDHVRALHALMTEHGDGGKKVWFTELGWSSHGRVTGMPNWGRGVSEQAQAQYLVRALRHISATYPYVSHVFWYTERDQVTGNAQNDHYGLLRRDLTPKPSYVALREHLGGRGGQVRPAPEPPRTGTPRSPVRRVTEPVARLERLLTMLRDRRLQRR